MSVSTSRSFALQNTLALQANLGLMSVRYGLDQSYLLFYSLFSYGIFQCGVFAGYDKYLSRFLSGMFLFGTNEELYSELIVNFSFLMCQVCMPLCQTM